MEDSIRSLRYLFIVQRLTCIRRQLCRHNLISSGEMFYRLQYLNTLQAAMQKISALVDYPNFQLSPSLYLDGRKKRAMLTSQRFSEIFALSIISSCASVKCKATESSAAK